MPRSAKSTDAKGRLQVAGVFLVILAAGALLGSLVVGLFGWGAPDAAPALRPADDLPAGQRVRVEVLNASGTAGLAAEGRRVLRDRGFDVVYVGNAGPGFSPDSSLVLDRVGQLGWARAVADSLGVRRVETRKDENVVSDVVVVLGRDWQVPRPPSATPP